jgi:parvulin-like peptidyl-prolyl isomerase
MESPNAAVATSFRPRTPTETVQQQSDDHRMTFRAKPPRRRLTSTHDDEARRARLVTLGFVVVSVVAVLMLGGTVAYGFYKDHFAPVARVGSTNITRDQWLARVKVDNYELSLFESRVREQESRGDLTRDTASAYFQSITQRRAQIPSTAIEELVDDALQAQLAPSLGVTVTDADIDAAIAKTATAPEQRHVLVIAVDPLLVDKTPTPGETAAPTPTPTAVPTASPIPSASASPLATELPSPTPVATAEPTAATAAQIAKARTRAEQALAKLKDGVDFGDIAIQYSTDSSGPRGGDLGFITDTSAPDEALKTALFALPPQGTTEVIEGKDHIMWIGRVTEIRPTSEDPHFLEGLEQNGVDRAAYRTAVAAGALRDKMTDALVGQVSGGPVDQVHAYQIQVMVNPSDPQSTDAEAHVLHILYSPNDDPAKADSVAADDPAWAKAKDEAQKTADILRGLTDLAFRRQQFQATAGTGSDDQGSAAQGGDIGWVTRASLERPFGDAIFDGTHTTDEIIGPVQTKFGWHVILFLGERAGAADRMAAIRTEAMAKGADFAAIARAKSEGSDASSGGDLGWDVKYQLDQKVEKVVFALQAGQVSDVITDTDGLHLYYVKERQERAIDDDQTKTLKDSAFSHWYDPQKATADIWRDEDLLGQLTSAS